MSFLLRFARETVADWKARRIGKPRNILPADGGGARTLRYIRRQACRTGGVSDCLVFKEGALDYEYGTNPCTQCKTQGVSLLQFSKDLWGQKGGVGQGLGEEIVDEADLRGWINGRTPIPPHRLEAAIASAWARRWLTTGQAISSMSTVSDMEAAGSVLRRIFKLLRRTPPKPGDIEMLATKIEQERENMDLDAALRWQKNCRIPAELKDLMADSANASHLLILDQLRAKLLQNCSNEQAKTC